MPKSTSTTAARKSASATRAASGGTSAKPVKKKPQPQSKPAPKRKRHVQKSKPLPPPIDLPVEAASPSQSQSPTSPQLDPSRGTTATSSTPSSESPLTPEAERILAAVPETIGDAPLGDGIGIAGEIEEPNPIAGLMAAIAFEEQDVKDTLSEMFDWMAERFQSEHWKLTDRQVRILGKPTAQLLNSLWAKLNVILPDILARWCDDTPGATAFILACGIVVGPKVGKQIRLSRAKSKANAAAKMVAPGQSHGPAPAPARPQPAPQPARPNPMPF